MQSSTVPFALAVDDDALIRLDACEILEEAGFRCLDAGSGDEAIDILNTKWEQIVVLFTDVEMPGATDGFALARYAAQHWPHIEIVVSSGRLHPEDGDMPAKAVFISKPFSAELVHHELRRLLPDGVKPEPLKTAV